MASPHVIFHMAIESDFKSQIESTQQYIPPTYEQDGFVHATKDPKFLLGIGNHFYKSSVGNWVLVKLDSSRLGSSKLVYEAAAAVGSTEVSDSHLPEVLFPHIYGPITANAVISLHPIVRDETDGSFLSIHF